MTDHPSPDNGGELPPVGPGTVVGDFRVMRLAGRGGMGQVYLARDLRLGRKVALKFILPKRLGSSEAHERFLFEARTTARFSHPNIVTIYAVGEHAGAPWVAMEFLGGQSLRSRMVAERPGLREALRIGLAIAEALREAHLHGVLHRDLKPENVLIPPDGRPRVVDFGLAKVVSSPDPTPTEAPDPTDEDPTDFVSLDGGLRGTRGYMAPEQYRLQPTTTAADIWAFGVVLHELLLGRRPYQAAEDSPVALSMVSASTDPVPLDAASETLPTPVLRLLGGCLDKSPEQRPTAPAIVEQLRDLIEQGRPAAADEESPFPGLLPFSERHGAFFFGRDAEIAAFLERLRVQPVLPITGPSGAGKSSFARAGVLPRLRDQGAWTVLEMRPGAAPFRTLAERLLAGESATGTVSPVSTTDPGFGTDEDLAPSLGDVSGPAVGAPDLASLEDRLRETPGLLGQRLRQMAEDGRTKVLLLVDQVEELCTLTTSEDTRRRFMEAICLAADDAYDPVRVIFTMRDDFLGRLALSAPVREALGRLVVLRAPGPEALAEVITRPLAAARYTVDDPTLVSEMVEAVRGESACLPLLQFAARMLWDRRDVGARAVTRSAYDAIGGVAGALAEHADGVLGGLSPDQVGQARELLLRLVTPERTRRVCDEARLLDGLGPGAPEVLGRLVQARLVAMRRGVRDGAHAPTLELAHESLVHTWAQLARWIDASRDDHAFLAEAGQAAELWEKRGRTMGEVWQGTALDDALRALDRCTSPVPEPVRAFLAAGERHARRRQRRRRAVFAVATCLLALVAIGAVVATVVIADKEQRAQEQRAVAEQRREEAELRRAEAEREGAKSAWLRGDRIEARAKLRASLELADSPATRGLWLTMRADALAWQHRFGANTNDVAFSPDGAVLAVACSDTTVTLVDTETAARRPLRGHAAQVLAVAFSPDGRRLASGSQDGEVRIWSRGGGLERSWSSGGASVHALAYTPSGQLLAGLADGRVARLEGDGSAVLLGEPASAVRALAVHPGGAMMAAAHTDGTVEVRSLPDGSPRTTLAAHQGPARAVAFSPDGALLATAGLDGAVRLWSARTFEPAPSPEGGPSSVTALAFSPDGATLASGGGGGSVILWDPLTGVRKGAIDDQRGRVLDLAFAPSAPWLASVSNDHTLSLWDVRPRAAQPERRPHGAPVVGLAVSPDGRTAASASYDGTVRLWDVATGRERPEVLRHTSRASGVAFSSDGALLASCGSAGDVRLWDAATGIGRAVLPGHSGFVFAIRFRPGSGELVTGAVGGTVIRWDTGSAKAIEAWQAHGTDVSDLVYSPDGVTLATSGFHGSVALWDRTTGLHRELRHEDGAPAYGLAFSPSGERLFVSTAKGRVLDIDVTTGETRDLLTATGRVLWLDLSPDGDVVGLPLSGGSALLHHLTSGREVRLAGHRAEVNFLRFTPDGALALTTSDDGTVRAWETATGRPTWHTPGLLATPPRLLTQRGWSLPEGPFASASAWREGVRSRARRVSEASDAGLICIEAFDGRLELWDTRKDERLAEGDVGECSTVRAIPAGCAALVDGRVELLDASGARRSMASDVSALGVERGDLLVVSGSRAVRVSPAGSVLAAWDVPPGATAVAMPGGRLVTGFGTGDIELQYEETLAFEELAASPVLRVEAGPANTVAAGFADGTVGVWSLETGQLVADSRLHGPVPYLLAEGARLHAASELGDSVTLDLSVFERDRCELLRQVWRAVPVAWEGGQPVRRGPPAGHPCGGL